MIQERTELAPHPAAVGVIRAGENILAVSRRGAPEDLSLPGGKLERREHPFDALKREVCEETGVLVLSAVRLGEWSSASGSGRLVTVYRVLQWTGRPRVIEPGVHVEWIAPVRLLDERCSFRNFYREHFAALFANA